jgi:hypothetical protein
MPLSLTSEQVLALAPDPGSARAARGLASPHHWPSLGQDEQALWGECQGSGAHPYQVKAALPGLAVHCTCPSRKHPCKHALGLLLLAASQPASVEVRPPPAWVSEWLAARAQREQARTARATTPDSPPRKPRPATASAPQVQARRAAEREAKVAAGREALALWLADLVRHGLAAAQAQPPRFWDGMAARLVDAQAPGLARLVRELGAAAASGPGWPERMAEHLGRLHLLLEGHRRLEHLPPATQADVRALLGYTLSQEALLAEPGQCDVWAVLGQRVEVEDQLRAQRTWLWGRAAGQAALVLSFAAPGQSLDAALVPGTEVEAEVVFYPSAYPQRALVKAAAAARPLPSLPGYSSLAQAAAAFAQAVACLPWLARIAAPLQAVTPLRLDGGWWVRDSAGQGWPMARQFTAAWELLALSGGAALPVFGEWDGEAYLPLSAWAGGRLVRLGS